MYPTSPPIRFIFLFLSNTGGMEINRIAQENYFASIPRENYNITQLQRALANAAFSESGFFMSTMEISIFLVVFRWTVACLADQPSFSCIFYTIPTVGTFACLYLHSTWT